MTTIRSELQQKAQSTILQYAIFRWESALVVALTLILFFLLRRPFPWWPPFGWPLLGLLSLAAIVYSSLKDAETNARVLLELFQEQFNPRSLRDAALRRSFETALEYQRRIETQVRSQKPGALRDRLESTANQISVWIGNVYQLAQRLDTYRADQLLATEMKTLPDEIKTLEAQRRLEANPTVQQQLDQVIRSKGEHWQTLRALDARMKQAALQMEQSLTALATIYSQVRLVDAESIASGGAERIQNDIQEQVARMNDLLASLNEVYEFNRAG
jgi:biopolymer transport protein ExbB/TolQ